MEYVIQALRYDLSCHSEDFSIAEQKMKLAKKLKNEDDVELYTNEMKKLTKNMKQLTKALKILNGV